MGKPESDVNTPFLLLTKILPLRYEVAGALAHSTCKSAHKTVFIIPKWLHVKVYACLGYYGAVLLVVIPYLRFGTTCIFMGQENKKELPLHAA
jgi:hypothetical protein